MSILLLSLTSTVFYITNQWLSVGVTDETQTVRAGSISYLEDFLTGTQLAGRGEFSGVNTGAWIPANGEINVLDDTTLVFHTDHFTDDAHSFPLDLTVTYRIVNRGLEIGYRFEYLQDCEFWDPLDIDFCIADWDNIEISNQTAVDESFPLDGSTGFQRFSGDQMFRLAHGSNPAAIFVLPNTSKGIVVVNDDGINPYVSVIVLDTEEPRWNVVGPDFHSVVGAGQVENYFIRFSMDEYFAPVFLGGLPDGAERSAAWMLDELPFVHPEGGYIWGFSETAGGNEPISAGLISLLEAHPAMKMNWLILPDAILTPNRDSVWFEPGYEDSWSRWHGTWRISTEATPDYLQWLINIQSNVYPWANRIQMGSHGYHHTPNPDSSFGEFHEFITYEPLEHQERFRMFLQDINDCGLDTSMVRVIRYAGHRTSLSGLQAAIDHGFTFYCNSWRLTDWYAGKQFVNQWISRYQTPNGRIWGSNTVWWGDYQMMYPTEWLSDVMEKGKFGLLGCHPGQMLGCSGIPGSSWSPEAYARIDSILTSVETDFDNFIWLFPSEYGDFLENCFNINVNTMRDTDGVLQLGVTGSIPEGLTVVAMLAPEDQVLGVTLDGVPIPWDFREGGRLFAIAPETASGNHMFEISFNPLGISDDPGSTGAGDVSINVQSPSHGEFLTANVQGISSGAPFDLRVYDITGRVIASQHNILSGSAYTISSSHPLPPGVYFVTVTSGKAVASARTVVIER